MSVEDLKAFGKKCAEDMAVQKKAADIGINNIDGLIKLGKENGFNFNQDDMMAIAKEVATTHKDALTQEQLQAIAGGNVLAVASAGVSVAYAVGKIVTSAVGKWR